MTEHVIRLPTLTPAQLTILEQRRRFTVLACGRRFGKTELLKDIAINLLLDGKYVAFFAPQYKTGDEFFHPLLDMFRPLAKNINIAQRIIRLKNGGKLECWSLRPSTQQSVRGRKYHMLLLDEAAYIPRGNLWEETLRPLLTDYEGGAFFSSTPRGQNWFYDLFLRGQDDAYEDWMSFQFPTSANPHMSATEIESARQDLPARVFEQEYLARFVHDIGAVFANLALVSTLQEDRRPSGAGTGRRLVFGIDWGRDVDFTVVCVLDAATRRQVALERFRHISWEQQRARVGALYREFMPEVIIAERNASDYMIESLISDGLPVTPFTTSQQSKMNIIDALAVAIENQWLTLLDHNVQKNELSSFTLSRLPGGGYAYSAPPGMHDDTVMALAFAWRGVTQAAVPQGIMRQMEVNW